MIQLDTPTKATATSGGSITFNATIPARTKFLIVTGSFRYTGDNAYNPVATAGGVSMTKRVDKDGYRSHLCIFTLAAPATGTVSIVVNPQGDSGDFSSGLAVAYPCFNVDAYEAADSETGTATSASVGVTASQGGSLLIDAYVNAGATVGDVGAGQTAINNSAVNSRAQMSSYKIVTSGAQTMSVSGYSNEVYIYGCVLIKAKPMGGSFMLNML